LHFWLTFAGVYAIFMPMHWLGLLAESRVLPDAQRVALVSAGSSIRTFVTLATVWTVGAQLLFIFNFANTLLHRKSAAENNPWSASTLEWNNPLPSRSEGLTARPVVYRGAYEFLENDSRVPVPQHLAPELLVAKPR